jgi:hypothetical protein
MFEIKKKPEKKLEEIDTGAVLYNFITPECIDHVRGKTWFLGMGVFVLAGALFGLMQNSLSMVLLSFLLGGVYTITHNKKSPEIEIAFTEHGLQWKNEFFLYSSLRAFWIIWKPGEIKMLHVIKAKGIPNELLIPIANADPKKIKETLGYYVPEIEGKEERFGDTIARIFKL